jgi:hypothetical protein
MSSYYSSGTTTATIQQVVDSNGTDITAVEPATKFPSLIRKKSAGFLHKAKSKFSVKDQREWRTFVQAHPGILKKRILYVVGHFV